MSPRVATSAFDEPQLDEASPHTSEAVAVPSIFRRRSRNTVRAEIFHRGQHHDGEYVVSSGKENRDIVVAKDDAVRRTRDPHVDKPPPPSGHLAE